MSKYNHEQIDKKWQQKWAADQLYKVTEKPGVPKWYALTMFPYTSGDLHIGHWYAMAPADVHARFKRMQGFNVLHPMGFDSFGLPAENAAIKRNIHPADWTMQNIDRMRRQLQSMGSMVDWSREVITCAPEYYKWTEWFFLKFYEAGLAYRMKAPVVWCPHCQTTLANEQVVGGVCERCQEPVTRRDLEQWFFRITKYADELLQMDKIDWPDRIKLMQHNWIGKSEGVEISFALEHKGVADKELRVFTTRIDTIFGVTFLALAPEHPLVPKLTTPEHKAEVEAYVEQARHQSEIERLSTEKEKTGVFTGSYVINRLTGEKVPLWVADYVLLSYGTGVVMAVPAHDTRDFEFAGKFNLPVRTVIAPPGWSGEKLEQAYVEPGTMVNSAQFNGMPSEKGKAAIADFIESKGWGKRTTGYRIRDWLISRQRYWGAPIPIVYCDKCGTVPVPEKDLPVQLPHDVEFKPTGESPLKYCDSFVNTTCPKCGGPARRETDTMDTFMCSSWYYLRYASPHYAAGPFDSKPVKYWLPVDQYMGGAEHAVMHLLYARFFTKAVRDLGLIDFDEPFTRLFNQGTIINQRQKMSKSRGNVITPDTYVKDLGADAVRAYLMFVGPWEQGGEWSDSGIAGVSRWLNRVWNLVQPDTPCNFPEKGDAEADHELRRTTHKTIKKATEDIDRFRYNTMLACLMEFTNSLSKVAEAANVSRACWDEAITDLLLLLAPTAPHLTEEAWAVTGHAYSVHQQRWPAWQEELTREDEITLIVQVNGKLRDRICVPAGISEDEASRLALRSDKVQAHLQDKKVRKTIYVPGRLINVVAG